MMITMIGYLKEAEKTHELQPWDDRPKLFTQKGG